jgi:hypothetical protein
MGSNKMVAASYGGREIRGQSHDSKRKGNFNPDLDMEHSINITKEALAIGKIPAEKVA